ncbi:MAG: nitrogen regulation protein NR(I) [Hydrogenovibrio sp.]|uniref:nitrogen regulation protein NR(I) n=1 Tax=Hydrogenovibrio sp. TaxID=2065821 RepID=UPI0028705CB8|nr:nitrogen regulation protein NR(I) [Hydrogenovibrio sp.]MDR9498619.1 nitrogen regulation protein NR(I) [Hydrogenovibrio sp.]
MNETPETSDIPLIWIVDDDASIRWVLREALDDRPYEVEDFDSPLEALRELKNVKPSAVISDVRMPEMDGLEFMEAIHDVDPHIPVIIMTAHADLDTAVKSFQSRAFEYLPKPFEIDEALSLIDRAIKRHLSGGKRPRKSRQTKQPLNIIGSAPAMQEVFRILGRVSQLDVTVLITGETGTGKELVARALYELSTRASGPFVAINTAAIPRDLLESELFGHEKGAFTGAHTQRMGRFEEADGGTLFLDEIGDMPVDLQTRLLRVLNDGTFYRVGGKTPIKTNVRIVAATHQNMAELVRQGRFREDLLYRLNVIRIKVPPLRERREDILPIVRYYLAEEAKLYDLEEKRLSREVEKYLVHQPWPGNVRQIRSLCTWLTIMAPDKTVQMDDLPLELQQGKEHSMMLEAMAHSGQMAGQTAEDVGWQAPLRQWAAEFLQSGQKGLHTQAEPLFEKVLIEEALRYSLNHRQKAAALLGWGRNTLTRKTQALGLDKDAP